MDAISAGKRCGEKCNGSTVKNAIVYFPPGNYLISRSIPLFFGTQIIGDAINRPTLVAVEDFVGLGVLSTDVYVPNGGTGPDGGSLEWYINTARFYSQIRNINIDITRTNVNNYVAALHYQVAQATTIENVGFTAKRDTVSFGHFYSRFSMATLLIIVFPVFEQTQQGMFAENGSGGVMSDLVFHGGRFGICT